MSPAGLDRALAEACRAAHASGGSSGARERCWCGGDGPESRVCAAVRALYEERSRLRRLLEAVQNYSLAMFDVAPARVETYLREHGWVEHSRTECVSTWEPSNSDRPWLVTVGWIAEDARPVDHLRDALQTLENFEARSRHEILAEMLPERDEST